MSAFDQQTQVYWIRGERLPQEKGDVLLKPSHTIKQPVQKKKRIWHFIIILYTFNQFVISYINDFMLSWGYHKLCPMNVHQLYYVH